MVQRQAQHNGLCDDVFDSELRVLKVSHCRGLNFKLNLAETKGLKAFAF